MALKIITVVLFTLFISEALTLTCYNCTSSGTCDKNSNCSSSGCMSTYSNYGSGDVNMKQCADSFSCVNSSINLGFAWMSTQCCSSDFCNNATASENQLKCHICDGKAMECPTTQKQCKGDENRCITATVGSGTANYIWKGCASANMCNSTQLIDTLKKTPSSNLLSNLSVFSVSCSSAGSSTFPTIFHLRPDLGGFLLILLVFGCSVLSM